MAKRARPLLGGKPAWLDRFEQREQTRLDGAASRPAGGRLLPTWSFPLSVLFAASIFMFLASDIWRTHGWPPERALLVSATETPPPDGFNCTTKDVIPSRDLTWRSLSPPDGRPATFEMPNECYPSLEEGDIATVVRVYDSGSVPRVYVNPVLTYAGAVTHTVTATGGWLLIIGGLYWFFRRRVRLNTTSSPKRPVKQVLVVVLAAAGAIAWSIGLAVTHPIFFVQVAGLTGVLFYASVLLVLAFDQSDRLWRLWTG